MLGLSACPSIMAPINSESPVFYLYNVTAPGINSLFSRHIFPQGSNETIGMHYVISNYTSLKSTCQNFFTTILEKKLADVLVFLKTL